MAHPVTVPPRRKWNLRNQDPPTSGPEVLDSPEAQGPELQSLDSSGQGIVVVVPEGTSPESVLGTAQQEDLDTVAYVVTAPVNDSRF